METIRQLIMTSIIELLKNITTDNGYQNDIGQKVFEWRTAEIDPENESEFPCLVIDDPEDTIEYDSANIWDHKLSIEIGIYAGGSAAAMTLRSIEGDVIKALNTDLSLGDYVTLIDYNSSTTNIEQNKRVIGEMMLTFIAHFRTAAWDLYTLESA